MLCLTLSNLLDSHATLITKNSTHTNNPWFTSYLQKLKSFHRPLGHTKAPFTSLPKKKYLQLRISVVNKHHQLYIAATKKILLFSQPTLLSHSTPAPPNLDASGKPLTLPSFKSSSILPSSIPSLFSHYLLLKSHLFLPNNQYKI